MHRLLHLLKLGWSYKFSRATRLSYLPYQFTIEPTNVCNLRCSFCPQSDPDHASRRQAGYLTEENFKLFLTRTAESGSSNRNINLTLDGEPFLNKQFLRMIGLAVKAGLFPIFATNGILLDREKADRLISTGPFRASIDFASDKKVFETIRGKKGHFDRVRENLAYLMDESRHNRGIHLDIHDITPYAGVDSDASLALMRSFFPANLPARIRFDSRQFHNFCGHLDMNRTDDRYRLCPYPWTQMAVTWDGDCVPCCRDTVGQSVLGNVFIDPISAVWNNMHYQRFRQNLIDHKPELNAACKNCDLPYSSGESRWRPAYVLRSLLRR